MNSIVILCGSNSCGKTTTLKGFFKFKSAKSPDYYVERKVDDKLVCAGSFSSPQEQEEFCKFEDVIKNIENRIKECENNTKGQQYTLLIPFTMSGSRKEHRKVNTDCILKPIEKLRKKYKVFVIYLRKENAHHLKEKDDLMAQVAQITIETTKEDYDKSAELERFLKQLIT